MPYFRSIFIFISFRGVCWNIRHDGIRIQFDSIRFDLHRWGRAHLSSLLYIYIDIDRAIHSKQHSSDLYIIFFLQAIVEHVRIQNIRRSIFKSINLSSVFRSSFFLFFFFFSRWKVWIMWIMNKPNWSGEFKIIYFLLGDAMRSYILILNVSVTHNFGRIFSFRFDISLYYLNEKVRCFVTGLTTSHFNKIKNIV